MASLALPAVLTMAEARGTLASLEAALQADSQPVIDASALQTLDTAAVAVLLQCRRLAAAAGKPLKIAGAPPKLAELARLYGVDEVLDLAS
ncbi:MAG: STAS domain-containing protein [Ideonella sp.]|jgi:phospholipid transport system transporter-binding protein|nr:STAS domain-containing protein [Ideonella sp.]MBL0149247.1 STAS domain-containing protein [Ideonella sp.]